MTMLASNVTKERDHTNVEYISECIHCNSNNIVFDNERGEKICGNCAAVLVEKVEFVEEGPYQYLHLLPFLET